MSAVATLATLEQEGYAVALEEGRIKVRGDAPPPPELKEEIVEHRDALKATLFLADPPPWLTKLFDLYLSGNKTLVKRTIPKDTSTQARLDFFDEPEEAPLSYPENLRGGKAVACLVSVSIKNICAAVAAEIGMPVVEWERIQPEVEEALGAWKESGAA